MSCDDFTLQIDTFLIQDAPLTAPGVVVAPLIRLADTENVTDFLSRPFLNIAQANDRLLAQALDNLRCVACNEPPVRKTIAMNITHGKADTNGSSTPGLYHNAGFICSYDH